MEICDANEYNVEEEENNTLGIVETKNKSWKVGAREAAEVRYRVSVAFIRNLPQAYQACLNTTATAATMKTVRGNLNSTSCGWRN